MLLRRLHTDLAGFVSNSDLPNLSMLGDVTPPSLEVLSLLSFDTSGLVGRSGSSVVYDCDGSTYGRME